MTRAPDNLLAVRKLLLTHLDIDKTRARSIDLEPAEVGIVGDQAHADSGDSYHLGEPEQRPSGYSVSESPRDRAGLDVWACALDVGEFAVTVGGRTYDLPHFSAWCVGQCKAGAPDTLDLREIIWSPDGRTVKRWDRLGRRSTGGDSHRWHTHFSFFRDAVKAGRDLTPLFRRYLTTIGLLKDDDMTPEEHRWLETVYRNLTVLDGRNPIGQAYTRSAMGTDHTDPAFKVQHPSLKSLGSQLTTMQTALLGAVQGLDTKAILARIDQVAAAELERDRAAAQRDAELAELVRARDSGELTAEQVLVKLRDLLPADTTPQS